MLPSHLSAALHLPPFYFFRALKKPVFPFLFI